MPLTDLFRQLILLAFVCRIFPSAPKLVESAFHKSSSTCFAFWFVAVTVAHVQITPLVINRGVVGVSPLTRSTVQFKVVFLPFEKVLERDIGEDLDGLFRKLNLDIPLRVSLSAVWRFADSFGSHVPTLKPMIDAAGSDVCPQHHTLASSVVCHLINAQNRSCRSDYPNNQDLAPQSRCNPLTRIGVSIRISD